MGMQKEEGDEEQQQEDADVDRELMARQTQTSGSWRGRCRSAAQMRQMLVAVAGSSWLEEAGGELNADIAEMTTGRGQRRGA